MRPRRRRNISNEFLSAGARAPDHGRISPWRFVILEGDKRSVLANAMAELLKRKAPNTTDAALESERAKAARAPLIVVVAAKVNRLIRCLKSSSDAVAAAVAEHVSRGHRAWIGAMWKTGDAAYDAAVETIFRVAPADHIVAFYISAPPPYRASRVRFRWRVSLAACSHGRNSHAKRCSRTIVDRRLADSECGGGGTHYEVNVCLD